MDSKKAGGGYTPEKHHNSQDGGAGQTGDRCPWVLPDRWRKLAKQQRELGAEAQACTLDWCADRLQVSVQRWLDERLSPTDAARESGYSPDHIRRLIRQGKVANAGDDASPKIRRQDLPRKPGHGDPPSRPVASRSRVARTVLDSDQEAEDG